MAKKEPMEAAPEKEAPEEEVQTGDLDIEEVLGGYEAQIGQLTGQIIRQNLLIRSLRKELTKKNGAPAQNG